jgi:hypothetical protein
MSDGYRSLNVEQEINRARTLVLERRHSVSGRSLDDGQIGRSPQVMHHSRRLSCVRRISSGSTAKPRDGLWRTGRLMTRDHGKSGGRRRGSQPSFRSPQSLPSTSGPCLAFIYFWIGLRGRINPHRVSGWPAPRSEQIKFTRNEHPRGATRCEWAVLVSLVRFGGPVTGPSTRSPGPWPSRLRR